MGSSLRGVERLAVLLVAAAALIAYGVGRRDLAIGIAVGGALAVANFYALRQLVAGVLQSRSDGRRAGMALMLLLKFAVLAALFYLVIVVVPLDGVGLIVGVSLVVVAIIVGGKRAMDRSG